MKQIIIILFTLITMSVQCEDMLFYKKIKARMTIFNIETNKNQIGLKIRKREKTIKRIKFYDSDSEIILDIKKDVFITSDTIKYIDMPEGTCKIMLYFTDGRNNVLYVYE